MNTTLLAGILVVVIHLPFVVAQIPPAGAAKPLQPVAPPSAAAKGKVAGWEKVLRTRRPQGSSKQAAQKQIDDFNAKQASLTEIASAPQRAYAVQLLASMAAEKDEDDKVRSAAADALGEILTTYALPPGDLDAVFAGTLAVIERKGDKAALEMRLKLMVIAQATVAQPQLTPAKRKAYEECVTQLLARDNAAAAATIREAGGKVLKIKPTSSVAEQAEALKGIKELDKIAQDRNLSDANRQFLLKTLTEGLTRRYNQLYHFGEIIIALEKLGDPAAIPALEAFLKAHPTEKIDPHVTNYVLGLAKRAVQTLQGRVEKK